MFLLREARARDNRRLVDLARLLDSVNMPTGTREMAEALGRSAQSFRGQLRQRARAIYLFCAEELGTHRLAGAAMIIAKHGTPVSPHYYLQMDSDERYSHTLRKMFRHTFLRLRHSMDGPTEVGGLIVDPELRRRPEKVGKQLSWVRFLYIAKHRRRFENHIIAEIMPPLTPEHGNLFWDHYGRRMTGLSFQEADRLSIYDKEFIRALFPDAPLYTFLLPEEVRSFLGAVSEQSRGAVRVLEQAGLRFLDQIDPFDAGPYYGALIADLQPVKAFGSYRAVPGTVSTPTDRSFLVSREDHDRGFRAVQVTTAAPERRQIVLASEAMAALGIREGDIVDAVPLP
jgi:arginine N-succinyltransferase